MPPGLPPMPQSYSQHSTLEDQQGWRPSTIPSRASPPHNLYLTWLANQSPVELAPCPLGLPGSQPHTRSRATLYTAHMAVQIPAHAMPYCMFHISGAVQGTGTQRVGLRPQAPLLLSWEVECIMKRSCACAPALSYSFTIRDWVADL